MAQSQIQQYSLEDLRKALAPAQGVDVSSIPTNVMKAADLSSTIQSRQADQRVKEQELIEKIKQAKAEQQLTQAAQTPVPTTKLSMLNKISSPTPISKLGPTENLLTGESSVMPGTGQIDQPGFAPTTVRPVQREVTLSPEELVTAQKDKQEQLKGLAFGVSPKEGAKSLLSADSRGKISGRDIQQFYLVSPNGRERIPVSFDEVTNELTNIVSGQPIDRSTVVGYQMVRQGQQIKIDASGNLMIVDPTLGLQTNTISTATGAVPESQKGKLTEIQSLPTSDRKEVLSIISDGRKDENIKKAKNLISANRNLQAAIKTDNKILIDRLGGQMQKLIAGDSGNLAQWEQRDPGARDYITRIQQFVSMAATGKLLPENKKDLLDLLTLFEQNYTQNIDDYTETYATSITELYPQLDKEAMKEKMGLQNFIKKSEPSKNLKPTMQYNPTTGKVEPL